MRTSRLGGNGWYAAVKFPNPLPEDVSFTSPEVKKKYISPDRTLVTFEPKPWKIETIKINIERICLTWNIPSSIK